LLKRAWILSSIVLLAASLTACHRQRGPRMAEPVELMTVSELYSKGEAFLKKGRTHTARKYFEQVTLREDAGELKDKATIAIADSYFEEETVDAYSEAISRYNSFLVFHAMHPMAPYCQYRIGLCFFREMDRPDRDVTPARSAKESFRRLIENYPSSEYVADAKEKSEEADNILAAHEIYIGDFYLRSGHFKSAKARYQQVLDTYPNYWNIPLVTFRLAEAEKEDGEFEKARVLYEKVISLNPDSQMARDAQKNIGTMGRKEAKESRRENQKLDEPLPKMKTRHWWQFWRR